MRYIIRYTVICAGNVLMYNDSKIKVGPPAMLGTIASSPTLGSLEEMRRCELKHLYQTDEQGSYITTPFDNQPKILGHMIHLLSI